MIEVAVSPVRIPAGAAADVEIRLTNSGPGPCTNIIFTIRLPAGIMRLRGREKIEVSKLAPDQSETSPLRIQADRAGRYQLTSANFSYRDHRGQPHRETGFAAEFTVDRERDPVPAPRLTVELQTAELPRDEWSSLRGRITNVGAVDVSGLEISLSGQVTTEQRGSNVRLEQLPAGHSVDVPFFVCAQEAGEHVPVHIDLAYGDDSRRYHEATTRGIRVIPGNTMPPPTTSGPRPSPVKILFLEANPRDTQQLRLDEEIREIQQTIQLGKERDNIQVDTRSAVRVRDISQALIDTQPSFVHFAGHGGGEDGSIAVEDNLGNFHVIPVAGLVQLFKAVGQSVECVIVNACSTERLARGLSAVVPCVIGMRQPVGDGSAILFSIGFYQALAAGRPIEKAFDAGLAQMMMMCVGDDQLAPLLLRSRDRE
jgi:hypothetical protein